VLTTVVSLEAIYIANLIQFTVNRNTQSLKEVEEDIDEIQEDVEELGEDVDEIQEDIEDIQEDVEDMTDEAALPAAAPHKTLEELTQELRHILSELEGLK
jgi:chromosome segregation ATPase